MICGRNPISKNSTDISEHQVEMRADAVFEISLSEEQT